MNNTRELTLPSASLPLANRAPVIAAMLAIYLIWGTTYLGIRIAIESFPPFLMMGIRFVIAGSILLVAMRLRGAPAPTRLQWRNSAVIGALMLGGGMGLVAFAQQWVGSGLAALMVASISLWMAVIAGFWGQWPSRREWTGILVGFGGVVLLNIEGGLQGNLLGTIALLFAPISWAFGSLLSRRLELPKGLMANGTEMLTGGVVLLVIGMLLGERITAAPSLASVGALAYLIVFGSIIAYSAYMWLLGQVRPTLATSYAYVNPVVAVLLGVGLANEMLSPLGWLALPVILAGVALLARGRKSA